MAKRAPSSLTKAKNNLRPYFKAPKKAAYPKRRRNQSDLYWIGLQSIRQETPLADLPPILEQIEENPAYPFPGLGNTFPIDPGTAPNFFLQRLRPLSLSSELELQVARLNRHALRVADALGSLARINRQLLDGDAEGAKSAIAMHRVAYGHSIVLAKKDLLAGFQADGHAGLVKVYSDLTADRKRTAWSLLCRYIYDMIDPTIDPIRTSRHWQGVANRRMASSAWYCRVLEHEVLGALASETALADALLRYSTVSLLDLVIFIWRAKHTSKGLPLFDTVWTKLSQKIRDLLSKEFSHVHIKVSESYLRTPGYIGDLELYRVASFFDDFGNIAEWRASLGRLAFSESFQVNQSSETSPILEVAAQRIAADPKCVAEVISELKDWESRITVGTQGLSEQQFLTAILVARSLSKINETSQILEIPIAILIAKTPELFQYVPMAVLIRLALSPLASGSPLLTFLFRELIYRKARNEDHELERRLAFMRLFKGGIRDDIIVYLEHLARLDNALALYIARTCSRTFLERIFSLMTSVQDVLETRLAICRWLADRTCSTDTSIKEEHDALERELANLDARSDLDSTRVHVDEESFREWFDDTQHINVARYVQTVLAEGKFRQYESFLSYMSVSQERRQATGEDLSADTQIGSEFLLLNVVEASLKAFSTDRTFGLDSYLSRRIRHGTLRGHVMGPVNRVLRRFAEKQPELAGVGANHVSSLIDRTSKYLTAELDYTRKHIIQIQSAHHPDGLIRVTWKTSANIKHLDAMFARVRERVLETSGSYDLFPDIYALAWDCLEPDLAQLRLYMAKSFLPKVVLRLRELSLELSPDVRKVTRSTWIELGGALEARVLEICGWFIRPVFRRDKYDLRTLINSALSIVRELNDDADFKEEVIVFHDVSLSRGSFEIVGDALFVLLGNAARHGKRDGVIRIRAAQQDSYRKIALIAVESQMESMEDYIVAIQRIDMALSGQGLAVRDRTAVEEGFSGLGKLINILEKVRSNDVNLKLHKDETKLSITFEVTVPSEISFSRGRA